METEAQEQPTREKKVPIGVNVDPAIYQVVSGFAETEDRPMSNMVERLLKTHPRVQEVLAAEETATV